MNLKVRFWENGKEWGIGWSWGNRTKVRLYLSALGILMERQGRVVERQWRICKSAENIGKYIFLNIYGKVQDFEEYRQNLDLNQNSEHTTWKRDIESIDSEDIKAGEQVVL